MKKLLILLLIMPALLIGQEAAPLTIYETVNIKVKSGMGDAFEAAVKAHNDGFHKADPHKARVFYNINGPSGGTYTWVMGPMNYAAMDSRPKDDAHNNDWDKVGEFIEDISTPSYWSYSEKLSHAVDGGALQSKRVIWMYDLKRGQGKRFGDLMRQIKKVYEEKRPNESYYVVWNEFANSSAGEDVALIFPFEKWSWMDRKSDFPKIFEEVHGPGSWHHFLNEFGEVADGRVDWMRTLIK